MRPPQTPYSLPSDHTPMETSTPGPVPQCRSRTWSTMARAAERAPQALRASWILAPRVLVSCASCSVDPFASSSRLGSAWCKGCPRTSACARSGTRAALPQMMTFRTSPTDTPARSAICPTARFWSKRVSAKNCSLGTDGAWYAQSSALVQAGWPATKTLQPFFAYRAIAWPRVRKIRLFISMISALSLPFCCEYAPNRIA
mmetsp:Transcript_64439/g.149868  ORF Transcript_64439/g.149868 Transcript_64439/m.149868 type:complete len:201 (-) Transcript_64439:382-984(-)